MADANKDLGIVGGNYDAECEEMLIRAQASGVVLIVLGGNKGNGFSVSGVEGEHGGIVGQLPKILRHVADSVEQRLSQASKQ